MAYKYVQELPIWQESVQLAAEIYAFTAKSELKNDYRLKDQIRAAAVSIVSNIGEGFEYNNDKQFIRFLTYAKGSCSELLGQFAILRAARLFTEAERLEYSEKLLITSRKLGGLIRYLAKD